MGMLNTHVSYPRGCMQSMGCVFLLRNGLGIRFEKKFLPILLYILNFPIVFSKAFYVDEAQGILDCDSNVTNVANTYLRHKVMAEAEDETILDLPQTEYAQQITDIARFMLYLLEEKGRLFAAIRKAKDALDMDMDSEVSLNAARQRLPRSLQTDLAVHIHVQRILCLADGSEQAALLLQQIEHEPGNIGDLLSIFGLGQVQDRLVLSLCHDLVAQIGVGHIRHVGIAVQNTLAPRPAVNALRETMGKFNM